MKKQTKINEEFGFWGTIKTAAQTEEQVKNLWAFAISRLSEIYPEMKKQEIIELLNSRVGRHFADYLLDNPGGFHFGVVAMKIAMLNKINMKPWMVYYRLGAPGQVGQVNEPMLYRAALRSMLQFPDIYEMMRDMVGCNLTKPVWESPEQWLDATNVTVNELKAMWLTIQPKLA